MTRPIILLDCDGVLADFTSAALAVVQRLTGKQFTIADIKRYTWFDDLAPGHGRLCYDAFKAPGFCSQIEPYAGAREAVRMMRELGEVYCVTSPMTGPHWVHERTEWLEKHFKLRHELVLHCSAKHLVFGDVLVDDKPSHVDEWAERHPAGLAVLWSQPYNRDHVLGRSNVVRCSSWDELAVMLPTGGAS